MVTQSRVLLQAGALDAVNRLTNSIAVLATISLGGWLAVCGKLSVGFIYTAYAQTLLLPINGHGEGYGCFRSRRGSHTWCAADSPTASSWLWASATWSP